MRTRVQRWGNSLGIRIPKPFAQEAGLGENHEIEIRLVDGKLVLEPVIQQVYTLEELLAGVTDENLHPEIDFGPAVGREEW